MRMMKELDDFATSLAYALSLGVGILASRL